MVARKKSAPKPRAKKSPPSQESAVVEAADASEPAERPTLESLIIDEGHRSLADYLPDEPPAGMERVENIIKGTTLSLADGSSIKFGEKADLPSAEADFLRRRGQVA